MHLYLMVMLRSTTGPYGRPVIEVAYGEMIFSLHRDYMGDDSSGRVVGVSAWCIAHIWHTRVNTSVGTVYIIFWFSNIKICVCILFSKSICNIKEHWWSLALSSPDEVQRMFSIAHKLLNVKLIPQTIFMKFYKIDITFTLSCFIYYMKCISYTPHLLGYEVFFLSSFLFTVR